jgi:hypothetical protein
MHFQSQNIQSNEFWQTTYDKQFVDKDKEKIMPEDQE